MANREVLDQIQRGYRMPRHENCPDKIYDYMLRCWDASPDNRPTFEVKMFMNYRLIFSVLFSTYIYSLMTIQLQLVLNIIAKTKSIIKCRIVLYSFAFLSQDMLFLPLRMIVIMIRNKLTSDCFHRYFRPTGSKMFSFFSFF